MDIGSQFYANAQISSYRFRGNPFEATKNDRIGRISHKRETKKNCQFLGFFRNIESVFQVMHFYTKESKMQTIPLLIPQTKRPKAKSQIRLLNIQRLLVRVLFE